MAKNPYTPVGSKFLQALKLGWMFFWRAWVIDTLFFNGESVVINEVIMAISGIVALIMVYIFKFSVRIFPLWALIKRDDVFIPLKGNSWLYGGLSSPPYSPRLGTGYSPSSYSSTTTLPARPAPAPPHVQESKGLGTTTGYEPRFLKDVTPTPWRYTFGNPGAGLSSSGFGQQEIQAGQKGERNFYLALSKAGLLDKVASFWSVALPDQYFRRVDDTDIDCILITNSTVYLIDLKMYKQGDLTYRNNGNMIYAVDNQTGQVVGNPLTVHGQMSRARDTFRTILRSTRYKLTTLVTFMPTNRGMGQVDCVWPGGVEAVSLPQVLGILKEDIKANGAFDGRSDSYLLSGLTGLVKQ